MESGPDVGHRQWHTQITQPHKKQTKISRKKMSDKLFLPFWNLFVAIFLFHMIQEGLKKLGLVKSK